MGKSLGGICVNQGFNTDGFELGKALELEWKFQKKVSSAVAFERHKKSGVYDVCFLESGTLIITELETGMWGRTSKKYEVFSFVIQESTMSFSFKYCLNSEFEQRYFRVENDVLVDEVSIGERLPIENLYDNYTDMIEAQIKETTGLSLIDFSDREFYRFKWVGAKSLLQDIEYALKSEYFFKYVDSTLIPNYTQEEQIKLFEALHQHAIESKVDVYHRMTLGNSEGILPVETIFKSNYEDIIKVLLDNPETESVVKKYYTNNQLDWLFCIDPNDKKRYTEILNDHLNTEDNLTLNKSFQEKIEERIEKKWWKFWK